MRARCIVAHTWIREHSLARLKELQELILHVRDAILHRPQHSWWCLTAVVQQDLTFVSMSVACKFLAASCIERHQPL